jgi:hypothetical protein
MHENDPYTAFLNSPHVASLSINYLLLDDPEPIGSLSHRGPTVRTVCWLEAQLQHGNLFVIK